MLEGKSRLDHAALLARFPGPLTLCGDRRKWTIMLVGGLVFAIGSGFVALEPRQSPSIVAIAWLGVVFFGLGTLASAITLFIPAASGLTLDRDALVARSLFRTSRSAWKQSHGFTVCEVGPGRHRMVGYENTAVTGKLSDWNRQTYGRNCALPDTYGLSADDLAKLLNAWRDRACPPAMK
jgi:hypothetical protein